VSDYLNRATAAGLSWPLPPTLTEAVLEAMLFAGAGIAPGTRAGGRWIQTSSSALGSDFEASLSLLEGGVLARFPPAAYALLQVWQNRAPQASAPDRVARYLRPPRGSAQKAGSRRTVASSCQFALPAAERCASHGPDSV